MKTFKRLSFANENEFRQYATRIRLLYFHVFEREPSDKVLDAFQDCNENEEVILLDILEDAGFLHQMKITVRITENHEFISKFLSQTTGVGAWARGTLVYFIDVLDELDSIPALMIRSRQFAFPPR